MRTRGRNLRKLRQRGCRKFRGKMPGHKNGTPVFCASLRNRNAHEHVTRMILCEILHRKTGAQDRENPAAQTLCEPAQSKCTWTLSK